MSGDGYPVAGVSWTQLTIRIRNHEHLARNAAHIWVLELAYCSDPNLKDLEKESDGVLFLRILPSFEPSTVRTKIFLRTNVFFEQTFDCALHATRSCSRS